MTSNGDHCPSPPGTPSSAGSNDTGNGNGFSHRVENKSSGEDCAPSANSDGIVKSYASDSVISGNGVEWDSRPNRNSDTLPDGGGSESKSFGNEERILTLINFNKTLVQKVSALRADKENLSGKLSLLEEQLRSVRASQASEAQVALATSESERKDLASEKNKLEIELRASVTERGSLENQAKEARDFIQALEKDRTFLSTEKASLEETNRIFDNKAKDALGALEALHFEHRGLVDERGELERKNVELEMEKMYLEKEVREVSENLAQLKSMHEDLMKQQAEMERDRRFSEVKSAEYQTEADEARKTMSALEVRNEALLLELKQVEQEKLAAEESKEIMVRHAAALDEEKTTLNQQMLALLDKHRDLKLALEQAESQLFSTATRAEEAEQALAAATLVASEVRQELDSLYKSQRELLSDYENLRAEHGDVASESRRISDLKAELEEQLRMMSGCLKHADDQLGQSKKLCESLREQGEREKQEKARLEFLLEESAGSVERLSRGNEEAKARVHHLESRVTDLEEELLVATTEAQKVVESRNVLQAEVGSLQAERKSMEDELTAAKSCVKAMQAELSRTRNSLTDAEEQLTGFLTEREGLTNVQSNLELELRRMTVTSAEAAEKVEDELKMWRDKVEELADALEKAKMTAGTNEKKAWELIAELQGVKVVLQSKSKWSKLFYPVAAFSGGAAALAAGFTFFKLKNHAE